MAPHVPCPPQAPNVLGSKQRAHSARQPKISYVILRNLQWWESLSSNPHVGRKVWPAPSAAMLADASLRGWGAIWEGTTPVSGYFDPVNEDSRINELELLVFISGWLVFARFVRSREITLVSDTRVTVHIVRNMTYRSPRLLAYLRTLRALCETLGVKFSTRHLASVLNI
jgi:hypothetical protein